MLDLPRPGVPPAPAGHAALGPRGPGADNAVLGGAELDVALLLLLPQRARLAAVSRLDEHRALARVRADVLAPRAIAVAAAPRSPLRHLAIDLAARCRVAGQDALQRVAVPLTPPSAPWPTAAPVATKAP